MTNGAIRIAPFIGGFAVEKGFFYSFNVEVTGAARLYRAASSDRRERGRPPCWASLGRALTLHDYREKCLVMGGEEVGNLALVTFQEEGFSPALGFNPKLLQKRLDVVALAH